MRDFTEEERAYFEDDFYDEERAFFKEEYYVDEDSRDDAEDWDEDEFDADDFADACMEDEEDELDFLQFVREQYERRKKERVYLVDPNRYVRAQKSIRRITQTVQKKDPNAVTVSVYDRQNGTSLLFYVITDKLDLFGVPEFSKEVLSVGAVSIAATEDGKVRITFSYANVRTMLQDETDTYFA